MARSNEAFLIAGAAAAAARMVFRRGLRRPRIVAQLVVHRAPEGDAQRITRLALRRGRRDRR